MLQVVLLPVVQEVVLAGLVLESPSVASGLLAVALSLLARVLHSSSCTGRRICTCTAFFIGFGFVDLVLLHVLSCSHSSYVYFSLLS